MLCSILEGALVLAALVGLGEARLRGDVLINDFSTGITKNSLNLTMVSCPDVVFYDQTSKAMIIDTATQPGACDGYDCSHSIVDHYQCSSTAVSIKGKVGSNYSLELQTNWDCCKDARYTTRFRIPFRLKSEEKQVITFPLSYFGNVDLANGYAVSFVDFSRNSYYVISELKFVDRSRRCCMGGKCGRCSRRRPPPPPSSAAFKVLRAAKKAVGMSPK